MFLSQGKAKVGYLGGGLCICEFDLVDIFKAHN